jgi:hypothetical protein
VPEEGPTDVELVLLALFDIRADVRRIADEVTGEEEEEDG